MNDRVMPAPPDLETQLQVGDWRVDGSGNRLLRGGEVRPLRHKAMELLLLLARRAGETVSREEIVASIWQGNGFVAQKGINNAIWAIRQALGDDPETPRYLETIPKRGYRLIAAVAAAAPEPASAAPPAPHWLPRWPWWLAGALLLAVAAALLLRLPANNAVPPTWQLQGALTQYPGHEHLGQLSPDGRWLAFVWWRGRGVGELQLRAAADTGAAPQPLAPGVGEVTGLAWSPDSRQLAFAANAADGRCTLWRLDLPAGTPQALARCRPLFTPGVAWSHDGRQIAFSGDDGLFAVAPDGSNLQRLTTSPGPALPDHQPAWARDGRLAFVRADVASSTRDLHERQPDGSVLRLSHEGFVHLHGISYAADGRDILYASTRHDSRMLFVWQRDAARALPLGLEGSAPALSADGRLVYALMRTHVSIARIDIAGGDSAAAPQRVVQSVASDRQPQLSADGQELLFTSRRAGTQELWRAAPDGSGAQALTQLGGSADLPVPSPDGRHVAFLGPCGAQRRQGLCVLERSSGQVRALAADGHPYGVPLWSPDGRELWISSARDGAWRLWRVAADGRGAQPLPTALAPASQLAWLDKGSTLVYRSRDDELALQLRPADGGPERRLVVTTPGNALVHWRTVAGAVLVLLRGDDHERLERIDVASGKRQLLGRHALGSFPERARFDVAADGRQLWVELADTSTADLLWARQVLDPQR